jgi:hypothetical protein
LNPQENKNDLKGENRAGKQQKIRQKKNDASAHALVTFIKEKQSADPQKEFRHIS